MSVRKTESRLPAGLQPEDLGQAVHVYRQLFLAQCEPRQMRDVFHIVTSKTHGIETLVGDE